MLNPGKFMVLVSVILKPKGLALVFPGLDSADVVKCETCASCGSMQGTPLMKKALDAFVSAMQ